MASSTSKKVVAVRFERESVSGFVNPQTYLQPDGIEVLTAGGSVAILPYSEVKALCFVREFGSGESWKPNLVFTARPKNEGLWVRFRFRDGDAIDGVVSSNLLTHEPQGFTMTPPDAGGTTAARMFLPKAAVSEVQVLGVIGSAARRASRKPRRAAEGQLKMFE